MKIFEYFMIAMPKYIMVLPLTLWLVFGPVIIGSLLAIPVCIARIKSRGVVRMIAGWYISFMRGTPMLAQLFLIYFALPPILKKIGIDISGWNDSSYAIVAFSLNLAAFTAEIYRAAYLSIEHGQIEAGKSIGMNRGTIFYRILVPQILKVALPNITNNTVDLLKNTSLAFSIGVIDIMGRATQLSAASYGVGQVEMYIVAGFLYWGLCQIITGGSRLLERFYTKD